MHAKRSPTWSCGRRGGYVPDSSSQEQDPPGLPSPRPVPLPAPGRPPLHLSIHPFHPIYRLRPPPDQRALHGSATHLRARPPHGQSTSATHRSITISASPQPPLLRFLQAITIYTYCKLVVYHITLYTLKASSPHPPFYPPSPSPIPGRHCHRPSRRSRPSFRVYILVAFEVVERDE